MREPAITERGGGTAPAPPWPLVVRAAMVLIGLTLLLLVDVRGGVFYIAWSLIGLALATELAATFTHLVRARRAHRR